MEAGVPKPTLETIFTYGHLRDAWKKVRANRGASGTDGEPLNGFGSQLQVNLWRLVSEIQSGSYQPQPLLGVHVAKPAGGFRLLAIPSVRDRVLQTAVADALQPLLENEFEDASYGYRPGRSVDLAVERVTVLRDQGYRWVVDADIARYFDEIDHELLLLELSTHIDDSQLIALIRTWLRTPIQTDDAVWAPLKGVPQGSPLSPLLANLYLDWFDEQLEERGLKLVRFADDFLVLCKTRDNAEEALELSDELLQALRLRISDEKTRVVNFEQGFRFLGVRFVRDLAIASPASNTAPADRQPDPPVAAGEDQLVYEETGDPPIEKPPRPATGASTVRTLYISTQGAVVSLDGESFLIHHQSDLLARVPGNKVDRVVLMGNVHPTMPFLKACMRRDLPVAILNAIGRFQGIVHSADAHALDLQRAQFQLAEDAHFARDLSREIIRGKLVNSRVVLRRYARKRQLPGFSEAADDLRRQTNAVNRSRSLNQLRGYEGAAARRYWDAWRQAFAEPWGFQKRQQRPAADPLNALLNFGYTLLMHNVFSLLKLYGLNTHQGFLHAPRSGHPALASDLMEEFRAPVVDAIVLRIAFGNSPVEDMLDGQRADGSCQLSPMAVRQMIKAFENKMNQKLTHPRTSQQITYRQCLEEQVRGLSRCLRMPIERYRAFTIR